MPQPGETSGATSDSDCDLCSAATLLRRGPAQGRCQRPVQQSLIAPKTIHVLGQLLNSLNTIIIGPGAGPGCLCPQFPASWQPLNRGLYGIGVLC